MPRGVKAKAKTEYVTIDVAENGWLVNASGDEKKLIVFTDLGELLSFLEEELEQ
jgi:hypothetical protein